MTDNMFDGFLGGMFAGFAMLLTAIVENPAVLITIVVIIVLSAIANRRRR
jgi:hypothetical protein